MAKSDATMKRFLDRIGDVGKLSRRRFLDSSSQDQKPWSQGGLSFGIDGVMYGSCDFAWYVNGTWKDPFDGSVSSQKPVLVVEATDCLNTRSWGSAQIQRFHHALGSFLCNINSVYYLNKGPKAERLRPYLTAAAYFATMYHKKQGLSSSYLVTTDVNDIGDLVRLIDKFGEPSKEFQKKVDEILEKMIEHFNATFKSKSYVGNWKKYLESREIIRCADGKWVKDIGARKKSFTDGSQRYGHIVVGEAITSKYLLTASGLFDPSNDTLYYLFPLMTSKEISELDESKKDDKEWNIIRSLHCLKVIGYDELEGLPNDIEDSITKIYRTANLNKVKGWEKVKARIRNGLANGSIKIK